LREGTLAEGVWDDFGPSPFLAKQSLGEICDMDCATIRHRKFQPCDARLEIIIEARHSRRQIGRVGCTDRPDALAIERVLECVAAAGMASKVVVTISAILSSPILRGAPARCTRPAPWLPLPPSSGAKNHSFPKNA